MEKKTYTIGGRTFYQVPLVAGQQQWLYLALSGIVLHGLTHEDMLKLLYGRATELAAILLIDEGRTQAEKVQGGREQVKELEDWLGATVQVSDLTPVLRDFFDSGQLPALMGSVAETVLQTIARDRSTPPTATS
jgi:hypothetical protein